jgi:hypothetical protein
MNYGKKVLLLIGIIGFAIVNAGCSFSIGFSIKNLSGKPIVVSYSTTGMQGYVPRLINSIEGEKGEKYSAIPENRIAIDRENDTVKLNLLPNEEVELFWVTDRMENDYESDFRLKNLHIVSDDGSISLEGRKVFQSFRPIKNSWYAFGPETIGFVFEYR